MKPFVLICTLALLLSGCSSTSVNLPEELEETPETNLEAPSVYELISEEKRDFYGTLVERKLIWEGKTKQLYAYSQEGIYGDKFLVYTDLDGNPLQMPTDFHELYSEQSLSPNEEYLVYEDNQNIKMHRFETNETQDLMSILDSTDGVDFYWWGEELLAMTVINQRDESYHETLGSKLYILKLKDGILEKKQRHLLRILYTCSNSGCHTSEDDVYFKNKNTLIYRTWQSETPDMDLGDDSLLRELEIESS